MHALIAAALAVLFGRAASRLPMRFGGSAMRRFLKVAVVVGVVVAALVAAHVFNLAGNLLQMIRAIHGG